MIHVVIGTRAQLLKMAPLMLELASRKIPYRWVYTAQHKDTMQELIEEFNLPDPDYTVIKWNTEAKTMKKIWSWFFGMMGTLVFKRKEILGGYTGKKSLVLTHGDTVTTCWAALLGKLSGCKVMHIESGLRSFNIFEPFPEEINRISTFWFSDYYACPGDWAVNNLRRFGGIKFNTEMNTQIDTLHYGLKHANKSKLKLPKQKYAVVSLHRYENIFKKERFKNIVEMLKEISGKIHLVMVMHPATKIQLSKYGLTNSFNSKNFTSLPRQDHLSFLKLVKSAEFVITDGGGNQEELYHMGKPTLLFREATERTEGLGENALLSGLDYEKTMDFVSNYQKYKRPAVKLEISPSKIIVDHIVKFGFGSNGK